MAFPTQREVEFPLLQEIEAVGGEAKYSKELFLKVAARFPQITEPDLEERRKDGTNRWANWVAFTRLRLVHKGELYREPRGIWRITDKGRERLRREGLLKGEVKRPPIELEKLAKKVDEKPPRLTHDELVQKVKEIGEMLGKIAEVKWGPKFEYDCVWKDNPFASPKLVIEVCDKGNLYKDITSLDWAATTWGAKGIWVIFDDSDFHKAKEMLAQKSQIYPLKAEDVVKLHSLLQAGYAQAIRSMFAV
jgi:hypothetical protein